ncbi:zinc-binding alcohol dehydrogenase family protein [Eupransor demetentiae]|uniref:NADPH:quinone reductase or related Zn-dependent oxidoreductase (Qor) n=1 Tax=Eupransor demetentiae TaxID=3109584 RepID=A0ABP0EPW0_9LACO|nr:NADPH:quinone reductase or related Zn-dependent oxidoreductase (Qor) [Lactobacillaceae bacterium LMG 33000]
MSFFNRLKEQLTLPFGPKMTALGLHPQQTGDLETIVAKKVAKPKPADDEILVRVLASSVNPVDVKMMAAYPLDGPFRTFGLDGLGEVVARGKDVNNFEIGERVFYVGQQRKPGADAEFEVVKADFAAQAPANLSNTDAVAMPLTSVTAYDILHQAFNLDVTANAASGKTLLIINGAGGVGSVLTQLAKYLGLTVITTAGNADSKAWSKKMGADFVLDYHKSLTGQLEAIGHSQVDFIANLQDTAAYWDFMVQVLKPFGRIGAIVGTDENLPIGELKNMGAQFTWVFMLARGNFDMHMEEQGQILTGISAMLEQGVLHSTTTEVFDGFEPESVQAAAQMLGQGHTYGKIVLNFNSEVGQ